MTKFAKAYCTVSGEKNILANKIHASNKTVRGWAYRALPAILWRQRQESCTILLQPGSKTFVMFL